MSLHVITIPNDLDLTSSAAITKFIDARAINPMMGFEMCGWLDDVYFNNASRTKSFEDGRNPLFKPHTSELADGSPFDTTVSECECCGSDAPVYAEDLCQGCYSDYCMMLDAEAAVQCECEEPHCGVTDSCNTWINS